MFPGFAAAMKYAIGSPADPEGKAAHLLNQGSAVMLVTWGDGSILTYVAPGRDGVRTVELGDRAYAAIDSEDIIRTRLAKANPVNTTFYEHLFGEAV